MSVHADRKAAERVRLAVLRQYATAHDHHAEAEQLLAGQGRRIEAEGRRQWARLVLRAYVAEKDDPEPVP